MRNYDQGSRGQTRRGSQRIVSVNVPQMGTLAFDEGDGRVNDAICGTDASGNVGAVVRQKRYNPATLC